MSAKSKTSKFSARPAGFVDFGILATAECRTALAFLLVSSNTCSMPELLDRRVEREELDRLLGGVRAGRSRALVIAGEPGVGKTTLLEYVRERASGCRVVWAAGVQAESELAFAALTSSARRCWFGSSGSRVHSATRSARRSACMPERRRIAS